MASASQKLRISNGQGLKQLEYEKVARARRSRDTAEETERKGHRRRATAENPGSQGSNTCSVSAPEGENNPTPPIAEFLLQVRVQPILIPTPSVYKPGGLGEVHLPETKKQD